MAQTYAVFNDEDEQQPKKFVESISQAIGYIEAQKLQNLLENKPHDQMLQIVNTMQGMSEPEIQKQCQYLVGMTAEQVITTLENLSKMDPKERLQMQQQMENMDQMDLIAIQAFPMIESEMEYYGKPWRYLNEYLFYGFSINTFTFSYSLITFILYTYMQQNILANETGECQQLLAGGLLPYSVYVKQEYFRFLTYPLVYNSYTHLFIAISNSWYLSFMIERPLFNWKKYAFLLFVASTGSSLNSINFEQDQFIIGNSGQINTLGVLVFCFFYKYRKQITENKILTAIITLYFFWFIYYAFFLNTLRLPFHLGSIIIAILMQPYIINMPWKLSKEVRLAYKILLVLYFVGQITLLLYQPYTLGPLTKEILKSCPQYKN